MSHFTTTDVEAHQRRTLGGVQCTCGGVGAVARRHVDTCPLSILRTTREELLTATSLHPKRKLKKNREPNQTEAEFGHRLSRIKNAGEIEYYGFEEITLRFADMSYTPDYFVIRRLEKVPRWYNEKNAHDIAKLVEAVYIEIKGGHKWEDSIIKWKAAKARFAWAEFQFWQKLEGVWQRLG